MAAPFFSVGVSGDHLSWDQMESYAEMLQRTLGLPRPTNLSAGTSTEPSESVFNAETVSFVDLLVFRFWVFEL